LFETIDIEIIHDTLKEQIVTSSQITKVSGSVPIASVDNQILQKNELMLAHVWSVVAIHADVETK